MNTAAQYSRDELIELGFGQVGRDVRVFRRSILINCHNIFLGDGCQIDDFVHILASRPVRIGCRVHVACFTSIVGGGEVALHDYSGLSAGCRIISGTDDFQGGGMTNPCVPERYRNVLRSFISIGKHAILGSNTIVFPGVTIHEGAAIGAGSVVTKDISEWSIYAGSPARRIRERPRTRILELERSLIQEHQY